MSAKVFIDGAAGTTGLEIAERLAGRSEFDLVTLSEERRKDDEARAEALNGADFVILCLPDDAARDAVGMIENPRVRVIDASSAHRTSLGWTYGLPEVVGAKDVAAAGRVSNPGCYPTGFIMLLAPLVRAGFLPADWPYVCHAVSGYSGGGKALIARFEDDPDIAFRTYGLALGHKHVPEMKKHAGLSIAPVFAPSVVPAHRGMVLEVPLPLEAMGDTVADPEVMRAALAQAYGGSPIVTVRDDTPGEILLRRSMEPTDTIDLYVCASIDRRQARLVAVLDNLGKGASGAAVQNLNLMAGLDETTGLRL
ncbi:N-acetyl-gamma-glutamyl-phosphate reductase [Novosphingobium marinum]|uniref:N-acetyl-gamma-glutamyl-phosphate reductase n=1 Tax=Novosphingobium marinum TaxID=1514948 RepID=A0A7Z0BVI5_9SPHN|nr:N-acetyl-gamma-glutamyl-phosphate reductase [Novosphingobium marinum]NYH95227.1 N-acetyl-gamma-glutamyl-phosphate reductase [Novosphingobium marinum]GGC25354.1 N-acetyl-gamma-glutamyl-phosphate reductase [Novosphingobium marinum]